VLVKPTYFVISKLIAYSFHISTFLISATRLFARFTSPSKVGLGIKIGLSSSNLLRDVGPGANQQRVFNFLFVIAVSVASRFFLQLIKTKSYAGGII
jgi:hypothetical protein